MLIPRSVRVVLPRETNDDLQRICCETDERYQREIIGKITPRLANCVKTHPPSKWTMGSALHGAYKYKYVYVRTVYGDHEELIR